MWDLIDCSDSEWSTLISNYSGTTYFQDIQWAAHSRDLGWSVKRWQKVKDGEPVGFLQGLIKIYFGRVGVLWFPDWIIGEDTKINNLQEIIKSTLNLKYLYIRLRSTKVTSIAKNEFFLKKDWRRPRNLFGSGMSMNLDISGSIEEIYTKFGKKWRKSLRRSIDSNISIEEIKSAEEIYELYDEMRELKSLKKNQIYSLTKIQSLIECFDTHIITLGAVSNKGKVLALRSAIVRKDAAFDIFAATGEVARTMNASHFIFLELLKKCKSYGCLSYDLGGIDPKINPGVYNFKKGTGAVVVEQLGEYEWTSHWFLSLAINVMSKYR